MVIHFRVVTQEKMNKTGYHLKVLFNFSFNINIFLQKSFKKPQDYASAYFSRKKIEIYFSTNIHFNQFFQSYKLKKSNTLSLILKKLEGMPSYEKMRGSYSTLYMSIVNTVTELAFF